MKAGAFGAYIPNHRIRECAIEAEHGLLYNCTLVMFVMDELLTETVYICNVYLFLSHSRGINALFGYPGK